LSNVTVIFTISVQNLAACLLCLVIYCGQVLWFDQAV